MATFRALNLFTAVFISSISSAVVEAGAPLDADAYCTTSNFMDGLTQLPPSRVSLMDSYKYLVLLGDQGAWQQVDLDSNNSQGRGTEVSPSLL